MTPMSMDLSWLSIPAILAFVLLLTRMSGLFATSPFFSNIGVPSRIKVGLAVGMSLLLYPLHAEQAQSLPMTLPAFTFIAAQEFVIGLLIGFVADLVLVSVRMSGGYLAVQMGLSVAEVLDPLTGTRSPVLGQFYFIYAFFLFLSLNMHHVLIAAVDRSFHWIPLGQGITNVGLLTERMIALSGDLFLVALMVALPVMGVLLVTETAMAFVAKVMPQMNIFYCGAAAQGGDWPDGDGDHAAVFIEHALGSLCGTRAALAWAVPPCVSNPPAGD